MMKRISRMGWVATSRYYLFLLLIVLMALVLSACKQETTTGVDLSLPAVNSTTADWQVSVDVLSGMKSDKTIRLWVSYMQQEHTPITVSDDVDIMIDGDWYRMGLFFYDVDHIEWELNPSSAFSVNETHTLALKLNGNQLASTSIKFPDIPVCIFPETFDPREQNTFSWELNGTCQYQMIMVDGWDSNWTDDEDHYTTWSKLIDPNARSYTLGRNIVDYIENDAAYEISLWDAYLTIHDRVAFSVQSQVTQAYPENRKASVPHRDQHRRFMNCMLP